MFPTFLTFADRSQPFARRELSFRQLPEKDSVIVKVIHFDHRVGIQLEIKKEVFQEQMKKFLERIA